MNLINMLPSSWSDVSVVISYMQGIKRGVSTPTTWNIVRGDRAMKVEMFLYPHASIKATTLIDSLAP